MKYADVKRTLNGIKETKKHWGNKVNVEQEQVFQEYSHSKNEGLADSLDFLTDNNGNNHYGELKNNTFECKSIAELKKGKHFTDYSIELEDNQKNNFQYTLRTEKNKAEIRQEWSKGLTGKDWLSEDIKTEVLKQRPHYSINNSIQDKPENAQPFEDFVRERPAPQPKL